MRDSSPSAPSLREIFRRYEQPRLRRSLGELAITVVPLLAFWGLALASVRLGWIAGALLAIPAAVFLVRLFMIQHDCGHGSLFRSGPLNAWIGRVAGVFSHTPYAYWRKSHAIHHATSGNLDRRWLGAVETLTVEEYRARSPLGRLAYRIYRHPLVLFGLGPAYMFVLQHRLPIGLTDVIRTAPRERFTRFYNGYYRPERATLIVVGDFDVDAMEAKIRTRFGDWKPTGPAGASLPPAHLGTRGTEAPAMIVATSATSRTPAPLAEDGTTQSQHVILIALDGVRWQEVFGGVDPAMWASSAPSPALGERALWPRLYGLLDERGAALGAPSAHATFEASGPNYVSLPGYLEMTSGRALLMNFATRSMRRRTELMFQVVILRGMAAI